MEPPLQVDLSGLRVIVTGSTKGIGRAVARKLSASGAEVAVNGRKAADVTDHRFAPMAAS